MSSIIKVDTIQTAAGGVPTAGDLGLNTTGSVLQVVQNISTTFESTTSTSYVKSNLTATITPTSTDSKILLVCTFEGQVNAANLSGYYTVYRDSTNLGSPGYFIRQESATTNLFLAQALSYLDSPSTTSATEYSLQYKSQNNTLSTKLATGSCPGVMTLMEIAG